MIYPLLMKRYTFDNYHRTLEFFANAPLDEMSLSLQEKFQTLLNQKELLKSEQIFSILKELEADEKLASDFATVAICTFYHSIRMDEGIEESNQEFHKAYEATHSLKGGKGRKLVTN